MSSGIIYNIISRDNICRFHLDQGAGVGVGWITACWVGVLVVPATVTGVGVAVGGGGSVGGLVGTGVFVGGSGVSVGSGVLVGGSGVSVGGNGVFVGGRGVFVGSGVLVGGTRVLVAVGSGGCVGAKVGIGLCVRVGVAVGTVVGGADGGGTKPPKFSAASFLTNSWLSAIRYWRLKLIISGAFMLNAVRMVFLSVKIPSSWVANS